jgi:hypothetical protein
MVRAEEGALAALDTDIGPILFRIPENRSDETGIAAEAASCTFVRVQTDPAGFDLGERFLGAGFHTGGVLAAAADDNGKPFTHPS